MRVQARGDGSLAIATAQVTGGAGTDTLSNIEGSIGSALPTR